LSSLFEKRPVDPNEIVISDIPVLCQFLMAVLYDGISPAVVRDIIRTIIDSTYHHHISANSYKIDNRLESSFHSERSTNNLAHLDSNQ